MFDYFDYDYSDNVTDRDKIFNDGIIHKLKVEFSSTKQPMTTTCTTKCNMVVPFVLCSNEKDGIYCPECFCDKITDIVE